MSVKPETIEKNTDPFLRLESGGTEIYLVRHGDALPGADEVVDGGYDDQPLSELGRRQSQALALRMREVSVAAVYSSPIRRARQTAEFIGSALSLEVSVDRELREVDLQPIAPGVLTPLQSEERADAVRAYLHDIELAALRIGVWSQIPGCEPSAVVRARLKTAISRLAHAHVGQRIAIVTHSGAINAYIAALLGLERDFFFPAVNTSISVMRVRGQQHLLVKLNDTAHLQPDGSTD